MGRVPADESCACMSSSPLDRILERESVLLNRVNEATDQAARLIAEAQESVPAILEEGKHEALRLAEIETGRIAQETQKQLDEIVAQREKDRTALRRALEANVPETVAFIIAAVIGDGPGIPGYGEE